MTKIFFKKPASLSSKLLLTIPAITILFWAFSSFLGMYYFNRSIWDKFAQSNMRLLGVMGRQSVNDIRYADFFQLQRMIYDSFDKNYMDVLALYNGDFTPLAVYPTQIPGEELQVIEKTLAAKAEGETYQSFSFAGGSDKFYFQRRIDGENGKALGFIVMTGHASQIRSMIRHQIISWILLGFAVLFIELLIIVYFTRKAVGPLRRLTKMLGEIERRDPEEVIPSLIESKPDPETCREVHVFYKVYRRLMQEIQRHQEESKRMAVQAAIGKVASHIAHDMRSPLSVIKAALDPSMVEGADRELLIETGQRSAGKLDRMADDLLDYAKAGNIEKQPVNIVRMAGHAVREVGELAKFGGKNINISVETSGECHASVDHARFNRVMVNFLTNAVQAIKHKNGRIVVTIGSSGRDLVVCIEDNGEGIRPEHLPRLFDSTFTFGKQGGSGLGLSYCKNVIEAHGGTIAVESVLGKGCKFTISIPGAITASAEDLQDEESAPMMAEAVASDKRILVMDDDEEMLVMWRMMLKGATGRVPFEMSIPEDLLKSDMSSDNIDVAIVDYEFRDSTYNGLDLLAHLKKRGVQELYLCTAYYQDREIREKVSELGIKRIIPKPIPANILQEIL